MRREDMKSPYSTTSDTLNVILISQSQSEPPLFNLSSPAFFILLYPCIFRFKCKTNLEIYCSARDHIKLSSFWPVLAYSNFLSLTCSQCCVGLMSSSTLIFIAAFEHNTFIIWFN